MKKRILIHNDNGRRDLLGLKFLERSLISLGFDVKFCNHGNMDSKVRTYIPHAIIVARGDNSMIKKCAGLCKIYIVPGEGGRQTKETMLSVFMGRASTKLDDVSWVSRCYLWNKNTEKWLLETGLFNKNQLLVAGHPRLDIYRYSEQIRYQQSKLKKKFRVGVAFSATGTSAYYGDLNYAEGYHKMPKDLEFPVAGPGRNQEDILWRDHSILRIMMNVIKDSMNSNVGEFWIRPNPLESIGAYKFLEKIYPGRVSIKKNQTLPEFLSNIDVLLTCYSTTGMEALLLGIPAISITGIINKERLYEHISAEACGFNTFVPFYHLPSTYDEVQNLLATAKTGKLKPSPKNTIEVNKLLKANYNWPSVTPTVDIIAMDIQKDMEGYNGSKSAAWKKQVPLRYNLHPILYSFARWAITIIRILKSNDRESYNMFMSSKNSQIEKLNKKISAWSKI